MQHDFTRAEILLRDLENFGQGLAPISELNPSAEGVAAVTGRCSRAGLLRMGVRLAKAALQAESIVSVDRNGGVHAYSTGLDNVLQLFLVEDPPATPPRPTNWSWMRLAVELVVAGLCVIGLVTVVRWMTGSPF